MNFSMLLLRWYLECNRCHNLLCQSIFIVQLDAFCIKRNFQFCILFQILVLPYIYIFSYYSQKPISFHEILKYKFNCQFHLHQIHFFSFLINFSPNFKPKSIRLVLDVTHVNFSFNNIKHLIVCLAVLRITTITIFWILFFSSFQQSLNIHWNVIRSRKNNSEIYFQAKADSDCSEFNDMHRRSYQTTVYYLKKNNPFLKEKSCM